MGGEAHHGKRRGNFIQRTIDALSETLERSLYAEQLSEQGGVLQRLDPRVKFVGMLGLIISAAAARHVWVVAVVAVFALVLALTSRIPIIKSFGPIWIGMFIFSGLIGFPAIFITPGPTLAIIPWLNWPISEYGLRSAIFLLLRSEVSITLSFLLIMTTPWMNVLKSMRVIGIPTLVVVILGMTYRYIFLMLQSASDMFEARQSRMIGKLPDKEARRLAAATVGVLLSKSFQLGNDVFLAMQSRGYRGEVYTLDEFRLTSADYIAIPLLSIFVGICLWFGLQ
ncbi:MAG: cobalt ECF transporter T component CbiQ [Roseiflexaceae bacterium]|jgi:cobalt ECF transporter T component CbiQ